MKLIYTRPDGGTTIVHRFGLDDSLTGPDIPADATNVRLATEIEVATANADRTFRSAWKNDLTVDMPKARDIHREFLRVLRAPKFTELDVEFMRAVEQKNDAEIERIAAEKQELRDVTAVPEIEAAQTPEQLKAVIPDILK